VNIDHLNLRVHDAAACRAFYEAHFGFRLAFEADDGFLLALVPAAPHQPLPDGFHVGFTMPSADEVERLHRALSAASVPVGMLDDERPVEAYVTFRCWDPDGTEIEVFWQGP